MQVSQQLENANSRYPYVYLCKEILIRWHRIQSGHKLSCDNAVALFHLEQYSALKDLQATHQAEQ